MPRQYNVRTPLAVIGPSIAYIPLSKGLFAVVDSEDVALLSNWTWCAVWVDSPRTHYAIRNSRTVEGKRRKIRLHEVILGSCAGKTVDHIQPGNGLDNRRANLRFATRTQQNANMRIPRTNRSGLKGVHFDKARKKWVAQIQVAGKMRSLGRYLDALEAKRAYDSAAMEAFGRFARLD